MTITLPNFAQAQVLVAGDVMLDRYWHGDATRISPEAPVPVIRVNHNEDRAGGASNVALNIATLGAGVALTGIVGADEHGRSLQKILTAANVYCDFSTSASHATITKLRAVSRQQQLLRMDFEERFMLADSRALLQRYANMLAGISVVVLSDYAKGSLQVAHDFIDAARERNITVIVDPKGEDFRPYKGATILTPNLTEFEAVVGFCSNEQQLIERAMQVVKQLDMQALLVTRGEQGMTLVGSELGTGSNVMHLPAQSREVFDVTGAGDTVVAVLAAALAAKSSLADAVSLANVAAGMVVGKLGTASVSAPELRNVLAARQGVERGVLSVEQLATAVAAAKARGEKIVMTNGCFDIIHAGHVGYIAQARELGQRLIVAVNEDASVQRLKGEGRPINPFERRAAVMASLESVDWVVGFSTDTPAQLIELFKPDVLVKGGDYTEATVVGAECVKSYGGDVRVLDLLDDCSTTAIVNKIREQE